MRLVPLFRCMTIVTSVGSAETPVCRPGVIAMHAPELTGVGAEPLEFEFLMAKSELERFLDPSRFAVIAGVDVFTALRRALPESPDVLRMNICLLLELPLATPVKPLTWFEQLASA